MITKFEVNADMEIVRYCLVRGYTLIQYLNVIECSRK